MTKKYPNLILNDVADDGALWIAIKSSFNDYRLPLRLNKIFDIQLKRKQNLLPVADKTPGFAYYYWTNKDNNEYWKLIFNNLDIKRKSTSSEIFDYVQERYHLVNKRIDFFIKILSYSKNINQIIKSISELENTYAESYTPKDIKLITALS